MYSYTLELTYDRNRFVFSTHLIQLHEAGIDVSISCTVKHLIVTTIIYYC